MGYHSGFNFSPKAVGIVTVGKMAPGCKKLSKKMKAKLARVAGKADRRKE